MTLPNVVLGPEIFFFVSFFVLYDILLGSCLTFFSFCLIGVLTWVFFLLLVMIWANRIRIWSCDVR